MEEQLKLRLVQELVMYLGKYLKFNYFWALFGHFGALKIWGGENFEQGFIWSSPDHLNLQGLKPIQILKNLIIGS